MIFSTTRIAFCVDFFIAQTPNRISAHRAERIASMYSTGVDVPERGTTYRIRALFSYENFGKLAPSYPSKQLNNSDKRQACPPLRIRGGVHTFVTQKH
jgi:hypothetical protein